jgi:outer membrane protein, adhesin transport system
MQKGVSNMKGNLLLLTFLALPVFGNEMCKTNSDELMSKLVANHPSIKMSQEMIKGAKERIDSAFWGFFPTPSVDVSARDSDRNVTVARLDQPLWTGGKLTSKYDMATSKEQENLFDLQATSYKLIENYLNVLDSYAQSKANIVELQIGLNNLNRLNDMLDRRMDAGVSSNSDKDLLNARIEQINSDMIMAKNKYKVAILQLELMLDTKIDCDVNIKEIQLNHSNNIEDYINRLLSYHPALKKSTAEIQTTKYELDNTKASIMPNVSVRAEHREGDLYDKNYDKSNDQSLIYVALTASTGAGLSSMSDIAAAKVKINEIEFKKQSIEKELIDSLLNDYNNYEITKSRMKVVEKSIVSAQNVLDSYERLFLAGKRQWLDLVNSSREVMQYKIELSKLLVSKNILAYKLALKNGQIDLLSGEIR